MDATLDTLLRTPATPTVGGKTYTLKPFGVRAVPVMSRLVEDVWGELMQRPDLLADQDALVGWLLLRLPGMIEHKIEDLLALMAMQTGESVQALEAMPLDDFMELGGACLEDAQDFFSRKILPMLKKAAAARGTGPTSSPSSSPTDTTATASPTTASPRSGST